MSTVYIGSILEVGDNENTVIEVFGLTKVNWTLLKTNIVFTPFY